MVYGIYIKLFAEVYALRRSLNQFIHGYNTVKTLEELKLFEKAFNTHVNSIKSWRTTMELIDRNCKELSALNLNTDIYHQLLHRETENSGKISVIFQKLEKDGKSLQCVLKRRIAVNKKWLTYRRKYFKTLQAAYKRYDDKVKVIFAKWKQKNPNMCVIINRLVEECTRKHNELQVSTVNLFKRIKIADCNQIKNLSHQCESIIAESLLKFESMTKTNSFKMKVFIRHLRCSRKSNTIKKKKKNQIEFKKTGYRNSK